MNTESRVLLALDTSSAVGVVCAFSPEKIYYQEILSEQMSHAKRICDAIAKAQRAVALHGLMLDGVFVGLGPGSFVGSRVSLATALGFAFGQGLPLMGFCSHRALAYSSRDFGPKAVLMKASGDWCYLSTYHHHEHGELARIVEPCEILKNDALSCAQSGSVLLTNLSFSSENLAEQGLQAQELNGPTVSGIRCAIEQRLQETKGQLSDESLSIKPNYVRAPSVSVPKRSPVLGQLKS